MDGGNGITRTGRTFVIYRRKYAGRSRCLTEQNRPLSPVQGRKRALRMRNASNEPQTALDVGRRTCVTSSIYLLRWEGRL